MEALRPLQDLIGFWSATGVPEGTRAERENGFWLEEVCWQWQFQGGRAWLRMDVKKGKNLTEAELHYLPGRKLYQFEVLTTANERLRFTGPLTDRRLVLERRDEPRMETQRFVINLLHANRYLCTYEVRPEYRTQFRRIYQIGATKQGVAFAEDDPRPECVVSGGLGTIRVMHRGETWHVCCGGCRDAFRDDPEKFIREYKEKKARGR